MVTYFTKLRLFYHKVPFIINALFSSLHETLYVSHVKLFAEVLEVFSMLCFSSISFTKQRPILRMHLLDGSQRVPHQDCSLQS